MIPTPCMPTGVPAPYLMTADELLRFLRVDEQDLRFPEKFVENARKKYGLRAVQVGRCVYFKLDDVLKYLELQQERNPR